MNYSLVTDADLAQARLDPEFRRQLIAEKLDHLLVALARLRASDEAHEPLPTQQLREGAQLAVKLADLLQKSPAAAYGASRDTVV